MYTPIVRAEILYNHVFHSDLPRKNKSAFSSPAVYNRIIGHRNFNPRLVALSLHIDRADDEAPSVTIDNVLANLDNPVRIWDHIVQNQLSVSEVQLLEVLFPLPNNTILTDVYTAWLGYTGRSDSTESNRMFRRSIKTLDATMVHVSLRGSSPCLSYHNPSVRDYMRGYISERPNVLAETIEKAVFFEQISGIWNASESAGRIARILGGYTDRIVDAAFRLLDGLAPSTREYSLGFGIESRCLVCLKIAEGVSSEGLAIRVIEALNSTDLSSVADDGDDLVELVYVLARSPFDIARGARVRVAEQVVEWVTSDVSDFENAIHAERLISEMGDFAPPGALQSIEESMDEAARERVEYSLENGLMPPSEVIDYMEEHYERCDLDEMFEGYSAIRRASADTRGPAVTAPTEVDDGSDRDTVSEISRMMSALNEEAD